MKSIHIGALQLPTLGMNATRLEFYVKNAKKHGAKVLLLGEYVLNHFFKELNNMPRSMVKEQSKNHIQKLKKLSKEFDIIFVAPYVEVKKNRFFKKIIKISPKSIQYYTQQILISYPHWNEAKFFSNPVEPLKDPLYFKIDGFKIAVIGGFELHFDPFWEMIQKKGVDLVLLPTASTFGSKYRWRELIAARAFFSNCYILRANRVGSYIDDEFEWNFYGDTFLVNPNGEIEMSLGDKESMLIEPISKSVLRDSRRSWGFIKELKKRGLR